MTERMYIQQTPITQSIKSPERRWASRTPLWLKVSLYHNDELIKYGLTSNFSLSGLFILCNQRNLAIGQKLAIMFDHNFQGVDKHCFIPAEVKRITNNGIAISFYQHDSNSFCCIQKMLSSTKKKNLSETAKQPEIPDTHQVA